jgi:quercetin dioxygenase-like cupin family protein
MLVKSPDQVEAKPMTMPGAQGVTMRLMVGRQDGAPTFSMRMFEVVPGGETPFHQHNYEHEVIILEGQCVLSSEDQSFHDRQVKAGDVVFIPANEKHQFRNSSGSVLRFLCMVPAKFDCAGEIMPTPGA